MTEDENVGVDDGNVDAVHVDDYDVSTHNSPTQSIRPNRSTTSQYQARQALSEDLSEEEEARSSPSRGRGSRSNRNRRSRSSSRNERTKRRRQPSEVVRSDEEDEDDDVVEDGAVDNVDDDSDDGLIDVDDEDSTSNVNEEDSEVNDDATEAIADDSNDEDIENSEEEKAGATEHDEIISEVFQFDLIYGDNCDRIESERVNIGRNNDAKCDDFDADAVRVFVDELDQALSTSLLPTTDAPARPSTAPNIPSRAVTVLPVSPDAEDFGSVSTVSLTMAEAKTTSNTRPRTAGNEDK